jgi:hypothetical protein
MGPCEGDACDFAELLFLEESVWVVQNLHISRAIRVEFDAVWGGIERSVDLHPREEKILAFTEFYGSWHANFIKSRGAEA